MLGCRDSKHEGSLFEVPRIRIVKWGLLGCMYGNPHVGIRTGVLGSERKVWAWIARGCAGSGVRASSNWGYDV